MIYVEISDCFLIKKVKRLLNPAQKAVYFLSLVCDRVELSNC